MLLKIKIGNNRRLLRFRYRCRISLLNDELELSDHIWEVSWLEDGRHTAQDGRHTAQDGRHTAQDGRHTCTVEDSRHTVNSIHALDGGNGVACVLAHNSVCHVEGTGLVRRDVRCAETCILYPFKIESSPWSLFCAICLKTSLILGATFDIIDVAW